MAWKFGKKDGDGKGKSDKSSRDNNTANGGKHLGDYDNYDDDYYGRWGGYTSGVAGATGYWKDGVWHANTTTTPGKGGTWAATYKNCHSGNTVIINLGEGSLYAGGWTRGAKAEAGWYIIDLADRYTAVSATGKGFERALQAANGGYSNDILHLFIKDFGVPEWDQDFWVALAADVKEMLMSGKNILVACDGGHGRTGMVLSILAYLLGQCQGDDPIKYIRSIYCFDAVETLAQEKYVYQMCGVAEPIHVKGSESGVFCCVCGENELSAKWGDDLKAEVCSTCIKEYKLTQADLDGMANDLKEIVKAELAEAAVLDGKVVDDPQFLGICVNCGNNLTDQDNLRDELCLLCHADFAGQPWDG